MLVARLEMATICSILVGSKSLKHFLRLLITLEFYANSNFYANHPAFQEYLNAGVVDGYDEDTLFTLCLTAEGIATWDRKDCISAINEEAERCSREKEWCGMFHFMALATILERPMYSVYSNAASRIREFLHRKILSRVLTQEAQDTVYIMRSRDGALDSTPGRWYQPNHSIPIFRVPHVTDSNSRIPDTYQGEIGSKPSPVKKRPAKGIMTNFYQKLTDSPKNQSEYQTMR